MTARSGCSANQTDLGIPLDATRTRIPAFRRPFFHQFQVSFTGRIAQGRDRATTGEPPSLTLGKAFPRSVLFLSGLALSVVADQGVIIGRSATGAAKDEQQTNPQAGERKNVDFQFHRFTFHSLLAALHKAIIVILGYNALSRSHRIVFMLMPNRP